MQTLFDIRPSERTLLEELEIIDKALAEGEATPEQERRGQEIVHLCESIPQILAEMDALRNELQTERVKRKQHEREARSKHLELCNYKQLRQIYLSIKLAAESDAQLPFDDQFRECLWALQGIAADPEACNCKARGWHGEGHDSQCPIRIATEAPERAQAIAEEARRVREPIYQKAKGGAA